MSDELSITDLIDAGLYDKDISEPTPLERKGELVKEVKSEFFEDLLSRNVNKVTMTLAWDISEDINGADEALNPIFLHTVLTWIDILEDYVGKRTNEV